MVRVLTSDITDEVVSVGAIVLGKVDRIVQFTRPAAVRHIISAFVVIVHPILPWIVVFLLGVGDAICPASWIELPRLWSLMRMYASRWFRSIDLAIP